MKQKLKKKEKKFLTILMIGAVFFWIGNELITPDSHDIFQITVDGELYGTYSLAEDQKISIGSTNVCEIKNGEVKMIQATCPDHLCMEQNPVGSDGGTIVCLPNKVVIKGGNSASSGEGLPEIDAVS